VFLGLVGLGAWLVRGPCYCWFESDEMPMHISSVPDGCRIVEIPEPWRDEKGGNIAMFPMPDEEGIVMDRIEFRRDPDHAGALMVARRGQHQFNREPVYRNSMNHFRFRLPASTQSSDEGLGGVEAVSDSQWDRGERLTATEVPYSGPPYVKSGPDWSHFDYAYGGRTFNRTLPYEGASPALSPTQRWIAVPSHSRNRPSSQVIFGLDTFWRPSQRLEIAIYSVASGRLVRRIRGWGCSWFRLLQSSQFHGDGVFSLQLNLSASKLLVCGMGKGD
jgi:hypothetical protein